MKYFIVFKALCPRVLSLYFCSYSKLLLHILNKQKMYCLGSVFLLDHIIFLLDFIVTLCHATAEIQNC